MRLVKSYIKTLVIDLGFVIQGNTEEELPERLLGALRIVHIDLDKLKPL